jgi:hypothetical protein
VEELHLQCEKVRKHGGAGVLFAIFFFRAKKTFHLGKQPFTTAARSHTVNNQY